MGKVEGLTWADVERVCAFAEMDKSIAGLRDSALIRLMSDCLLRVSEAVAVDVEDLKDKTLIVKSSKTDQEGVGETLYVTSDTRRVINRYIAKAGIEGGALFRSVRRGDHVQAGRLTARSARRQITYWAELAGVEGFISGHSLRVGSAVSLGSKRGLPLSICRSLVGGSRQRCRRIMRKQSWRNGARLPGSKKREGNDDLPHTQSDGVPRRTQERGIYASILERSSTLCGEQDEKSD